NHARKIFRIPRLIKLVTRLAVEVRQLRTPLGGDRLILGGKSPRWPETEMVFLINHRIVRVGMLIVAFRQEHNRAQVNWMAPEFGEHFTLYFVVFGLRL